MNKILIGISGKMGSGKTTMTNALLDYFPDSRRISLADPIKELQNDIYNKLGLTMVGEKDRDLLIALGKWGRNKHPDFWLDALKKSFDSYDETMLICDDIRFENEASFFDANGILVRLTGLQRGANVDHNVNDPTETALDWYSFQYSIDNRRPLEHCTVDLIRYILKNTKSKEL